MLISLSHSNYSTITKYTTMAIPNERVKVEMESVIAREVPGGGDGMAAAPVELDDAGTEIIKKDITN